MAHRVVHHRPLREPVSGHGLLVDLGRPVTITAVQLTLGRVHGANFQLRVGAVPALADLAPVAHAANAGGVVRLRLTTPAHGRYVLIWFPSLPPNRAGTFQASVYNLRLEGRASLCPIGGHQWIRVLLDRVTELRMEYLDQVQHVGVPGYLPGEIAQCGFWFPSLEVSVGFGQTRSALQLPVLTMIGGHSRWLSAILIPTRKVKDLFPSWWELLEQLGSVPRVLTWDGEVAIGWQQSGKENHS